MAPVQTRSERRFRMFIATSFIKALRRPLESAQYTSLAFGQRCREMGVRPSMGSVGDAYDNAMAESFFATLECELIARCRFETQAQARLAVFDFIEGFYNPRRRHSALGYLSPNDFERQHHNSMASPGASEPAAVLTAVKDKPCGRAKRRDLDGRCARRPMQRAGRDGGTAAAGAEQRNITREDDMPSNQIP